MSNTKHTPGPWGIVTSRDWVYVNAHGNIAKIPNSDYCVENDIRDETALANAKLIAAAPELLEALTKILESYKMYVKKADQSEFVITAKAAIKKATE